MKDALPKWIVVTDFDGTLTTLDVGNELCKEVIPDLFRHAHASYKQGFFDLKELQRRLWNRFPMSESRFRAQALHYGRLRPGVVEFLERCVDQAIPVFVASCGVRPYIETVLDALLPSKARSAIVEIVCNEARFDESGIAEFTPPLSAPDCPYPLDKGAWAQDVRRRYPGARIFAAGNGTSDRSFAGKVDLLAATESLADWARSSGTDFLEFEDFQALLDAPLFKR